MLLPRPEIRMTIFFIRRFYHSPAAKIVPKDSKRATTLRRARRRTRRTAAPGLARPCIRVSVYNRTLCSISPPTDQRLS
jgi:hypothetical protein